MQANTSNKVASLKYSRQPVHFLTFRPRQYGRYFTEAYSRIEVIRNKFPSNFFQRVRWTVCHRLITQWLSAHKFIDHYLNLLISSLMSLLCFTRDLWMQNVFSYTKMHWWVQIKDPFKCSCKVIYRFMNDFITVLSLFYINIYYIDLYSEFQENIHTPDDCQLNLRWFM